MDKVIDRLFDIVIYSSLSPVLNKLLPPLVDRFVGFLDFLFGKIFRRNKNTVIIRNTIILSNRGVTERGGRDMIRGLASYLSYKNAVFEQSTIDDAHLTARPRGKVYYREFECNFSRVEEVKDAVVTTRETVQITSRRSRKEIIEFLNRARDWYSLSNGHDKKQRYIYHIGATSGYVYAFNSNVTFNEVFIPECEQIIGMLDDLKSGKLSKLSFLFHGQPGCGKTSLVKAIANYTKRHIINVSFNDDWTEEKLIDLCFESTVAAGGRAIAIPMRKRIVLFEDFDRDSSIILQEQYKSKTPKKDNSYGIYSRPVGLAKLLNVLDGIQEMRDVILIFTTNNRDKIDPAMVRPGRMDCILELGAMMNSQAQLMMKRYCDGKSFDVPDRALTPAALESYCKMARGDIEKLRELVGIC
jgi:ATPase family associated with various cellular activities (AAA)